MAFSIGEFINSFTSSKNINKVLLSPIWMAVIIVGVMVIISYFIFRDYADGDIWGLIIKQGLYGVLILFGVMFLHDKALKDCMEEKHKDRQQESIVSAALPEFNMTSKPFISSAPEPPTTGASESGVIYADPSGGISDDYFS